MYNKKIIVALFIASLFSFKSFSQFTATWAFTANTTGIKAGAQLANVTIANAVIGDTLGTNISYSNTTGISLSKSSTSNTWPLTPTNGWHIDFPISPIAGQDASLQSFSFSASTSNGSSSQQMLAQLAYEKDGNGSFVLIGTPVTISSGNTVTPYSYPAFTSKLYDGHTYKIRMFIYGLTANISSKTLKIKNAVFNGTTNTAGTQPSVTTTSAVKTGKYTGLATGVVTAGTLLVAESGIVWDLATNPTVALSTKNNAGPLASGNIGAGTGGNIAGLTAATTYHTRAYVLSESGDIFYGTDLTFTTDAPTAPSLTTNVATNITSIKAISGGVILDSGGVGITAKGVCWSTATNPTIALPTKTVDGIGNASFASSLKILAPSTTYYARAYATNSIATAYGNEVSFTTFAPEPVIITTTGNSSNSIPFGSVIVNNISGVKSYTLNASALNPLGGNITIIAPTGFQISLSPANGFGSTLNVPYTAGAIAATTIYVRFIPNQFGAFAGTITHTGGGATALNIDDVNVTGTGIQNPGDLTNAGTDFWTGFGYQSNMDQSPTSGDAAHISIFVATGNQPSTIVVELPGIPGATSFPQTYTIPANSYQEISGFPLGGNDKFNSLKLPDSRLYYTGVSNRGIHIFSTDNVPVSVWMYTYTKNNSAGASMIFPTNTWGSNYSVQSFGGPSNAGDPNAFFYVIAKDDNTTFTFKPTADILDSSAGSLFTSTPTLANVKYHKDSTYLITLNKGQVFNAMGYIQGGEGLDLSGTSIKSLDCDKKIAVFGGNGRVIVNTPTISNSKGSDNLVQQMFPNAAWGTKYLTVPTKTMEQNLYRVFVQNQSTLVWLNSSVHTAATALPVSQYNAQGKFYYFENNQPNLIESDQPISVIQFIIAGFNVREDIGNGGKGDPEMIILSSVKQSINSATVYSANFKNGNGGGSYINVVIKKEGVSSFKIDGLAVADTGLSSYSNVGVPAIYGPGANTTIPMVDIFLPHPSDPSYSYAKIRVESGFSHTILSDYPFNAIAYGMSDGESYGYNAGTNIKPENQFLTVQNPYQNLTNDSVISACLNNDFKYTVNLPYKPLTMKWDFFNNTIQQPFSDTILVTNPAPVDSSIVNGTKLYKYSLPTTYKFTSTGTFPVNITVNATNADGCTGLQTITFSLKVINPPTADFTTIFNGCPTDIVNFNDISNGNGSSVVGWEWNFGGSNPPNTSNLQNPATSYLGAGTYNVTLRAINAIGCYKDTTKQFKIEPLPSITSVTANNTGPDCAGRNITFTANATTSLGTIVKWYWEFSDGKKDTTTTNQVSHIFNPSAFGATAYTVKVFVETSNGCRSTVTTFNQTVYLLKASFTYLTPQCINTPVTFTNTSSGEITSALIDTKLKWTFGDAASSTSTTNPATFTYNTSGTFTVKLRTSLVFGLTTEFCADSATNTIVIQDKLAKPVVTVDATKTTTTSLTFNWAAITGATGYQVSTNGGATWSTPSSGAIGTTHVLSALTPNTIYGLCVKTLGNCSGDTACTNGKTLIATTDVFVPNVFTPNGQGSVVNNKLLMCANNVKTVRFMVFNQWGQKIYETSNPTLNGLGCYEVWDGNAQGGQQQPTGVYVYATTITYNDDKIVTKKGMFNLIR